MIQHQSSNMTDFKAKLLRSLLILLDIGIMISLKTEKAQTRSQLKLPDGVLALFQHLGLLNPLQLQENCDVCFDL